MEYRESRPSPALARIIKCFWAIEDNSRACNVEPVLPDGCPEIVFDLADRFRRVYADGTYETQPFTIVSGQLRTAISIVPTGKVNLFGVRFHPSSAFSFLKVPMSELTDRIEPLDAIIGSKASELEESVANATSFEDRVRIFEAEISKLLPDHRGDSDVSWQLSQEIIQRSGRVTVAELCRVSGYGERKLERVFHRHVGVSPSLFSRTIRFQNLVREIETSDSTTFLDAALEYSYYDQSHMIRDFQAFAGTSPLAFFRKHHRISELFTTSA